MSDILWALLLVYAPTLLVCVLFFLWGRATRIVWLGRLLRTTAKTAALYFIVLVIGVFGVVGTCDGNVLKGVSNCTLLTDTVAKFIVGLGFVSYALAMFYALILFTAGGLVEMLQPAQND